VGVCSGCGGVFGRSRVSCWSLTALRRLWRRDPRAFRRIVRLTPPRGRGWECRRSVADAANASLPRPEVAVAREGGEGARAFAGLAFPREGRHRRSSWLGLMAFITLGLSQVEAITPPILLRDGASHLAQPSPAAASHVGLQAGFSPPSR
jgi:hypothetical protein